MCAGALSLVGMGRVYFGCPNDKFGGCGSILAINEQGCGQCGRDSGARCGAAAHSAEQAGGAGRSIRVSSTLRLLPPLHTTMGTVYAVWSRICCVGTAYAVWWWW